MRVRDMRKRRSNKPIIAILSFLLVYFLLLEALLLCEKGQPGSQIETLGDAIWFSLVTISTVGYGDVTPVTTAGHVIGFVFLLLSMGVLVALFGSVVSVLTSEGLPMMKLQFNRKKDWYYIAEFTAEGDAFARDILREDPDAVIIFGVSREKEIEKPDYPCLFINVSPARIVSHKKGIGNRCKLFYLEEDDIWHNLKAADVHTLDADVYARTMSGQEKLSDNIHFFHSYDCCARSYWRENPLDQNEDVVVLIGFGNYGTALLERAILMNINDSDFDVAYHVFGDARRFLEIHMNLDYAFGINERRAGYDSLFFHEEDWTSAHDIIAQADRIIICDDDESVCWDIYWQILRYYWNGGKIYLRSSRETPDVAYFGTIEQIYTMDQIVRTRLNYAAILMNDLYRNSVENSLDWDELSDQLKQSKIAAADHLLMKVRILLNDRSISRFDRKTFLDAYKAYWTEKNNFGRLDSLRRIEHARWIRFYTYFNWVYGPVRDDRKRENPMICDYDLLSPEQKAHHDHAWELLGEIAKLIKSGNV